MSKGLKVDLTQQITNFRGQAINVVDQNAVKLVMENLDKAVSDVDPNLMGKLKENVSKANFGKPLTLQEVIFNSIESYDGDKKYDMYLLGEKCVSDEPVLTDDERTEIQKLVKKSKYNTVVIGRVVDMLESSNLVKEK